MDINLNQILFQIVNISVVIGALSYMLYKPILRIFDERRKRIEEGQRAATEAMEERAAVELMRSEVQTKLKKERTKAIDAATKEVAEHRQLLINQAQIEVEAIIAQAKKAWETEKAEQQARMQASMVDAIIATTGVVVGKSISKKDHQALIDTELQTVLKAL